MYVCRLFHTERPFEQLEARLLAEGSLSIGRDPSADWVVSDPSGLLSRLHCILSIEEGRLILRDRSTNGVVVNGADRAPRDVAVPLEDQDSLQLGALTIQIERMQAAACDPERTYVLAPGWARATPAEATWLDPAPPAVVEHRDASLMEAFCEGAGLDASALSSEDPAELMRRIGAVYQQAVLGLAALMTDRAELKRARALEHTTISAQNNNLFKWSASRRLAEQLLCGADPAFLSGAPAVRACFEDLSLHMAGLVAGAEAAAAAAIEVFDPASIEAELKSGSGLLRGRGARLGDVLAARRDRLTGGENGTQRSATEIAFASAYDRVTGAASHA